MKILLIVPVEEDVLVRYAKEDADIDVKNTTQIQMSDANKYDLVYLYPGILTGKITNRSVIKSLGIPAFRIATHHGGIVLFQHRYDADYSGINNVKFRVINISLMVHPRKMLEVLSQYPVVNKQQLAGINENCIYAIDNKILCFIAFTDPGDVVNGIMPVVPVNETVSSNFNFDEFFNCKHMSKSDFLSLGNEFWRLQVYRVWDSFYDTVY